jgi:hypothetical protein
MLAGMGRGTTRAELAARAGIAVAALALVACRDVSGFSTTDGDSYEGAVVSADFVLSGTKADARLCMTIDTDHLQDVPGFLSTSDGLFAHAPFRPIPQLWHDPLSTLSFGEGRLKNLLYVVSASTGDDVFAVVSLMQSGNVEVRLLRGAPAPAPGDGGPPMPGGNLFAVFGLSRQERPCSY